MPIYLYLDDRTNKIHEIVQKMTDKHEAFASDGYKLNRIFCKPRASIDTKIDKYSSKEFVAKTAKRGMTIQNMWDLSAELSEQRGGITGLDPIKDKAEKDYEKKTGGKKHPHSKQREIKPKISLTLE